jgi:hypothetical protein
MKKVTLAKSVWPPDDLLKGYLAEAVNAFKVDSGQGLATSTGHIDQGQRNERLRPTGGPTPHGEPRSNPEDPDCEGISHDHIPRRRLSGGTEGKTVIPMKSILRQISDMHILMTPVVQAGVVSPGASGSAALPQPTKEEEDKKATGKPIEGEEAIAQAKATAKELTDAAAANVNADATAAQASAAIKKVQTQATQVQKQTKSEVPLELVAKEVQSDAQLESTAKERIPAVTADTAALIMMMQTMQQNIQNTMSVLQTQMQTQLTDQRRDTQAWLQSMEDGSARSTGAAHGLRGSEHRDHIGGDNAHQSHLLVQDLKNEMGQQKQRVGTMNTAIPNVIFTMSAKPGTEASLPLAARLPAVFPLAVPEPTVHKDGPCSSAAQVRHGEYLQSAVPSAMTALATRMLKKVRAGFSRWASHAYATKLSQKRKITGDQATVLNK